MNGLLEIISKSQDGVVESTRAARKEEVRGHDYLGTYTPTAEKIVKIISNGFGCEKRRVYDLMTLVSKDPLPPLNEEVVDKSVGKYAKEKYAKEGTIIVILDKYNSHNYPVCEPVLTMSTSEGFRMDGSEGNNFANCASNEGWRYGTDAEVKKFFDKICTL
jgi:hypothetical protein